MRPTVAEIRNEVEQYFGYKPGEFCIVSRKREIVVPRQIAMYFAKNYTYESLAKIGYALGKKDHATVLHACKTVINLMETDKEFRYKIQSIQSIINAKFTNVIVDTELSSKSRAELINLLMLSNIQKTKLIKKLYKIKRYINLLKLQQNVRTKSAVRE